MYDNTYEDLQDTYELSKDYDYGKEKDDFAHLLCYLFGCFNNHNIS